MQRVVKIKDKIEKVCISTNSICNFLCRYCYFYNPENSILIKTSGLPEKKLTEYEIKTILDKIYDYSIENNLKKKIKVIFVGSGEPLLSWKEISLALEDFNNEGNQKEVKLYMVTNGSLITDQIAKKMKAFRLIPSVSLDGPAFIHNKDRIDKNGNPTFDIVMKGIEILRNNNFKIIINPVITVDLIKNLNKFFDFISEQKFDKVVFGRIVDAPSFYPTIHYDKFYDTLETIYNLYKKYNLQDIEIGNIEAFRKAVIGEPNKVCTLIGSCCGAGTSNIIYLQRAVYPCGRMFHKKNWQLGKYNQNLEVFQRNMVKKLENYAKKCEGCTLQDVCVRDCILETSSPLYNCKSRQKFLKLMIKEFK